MMASSPSSNEEAPPPWGQTSPPHVHPGTEEESSPPEEVERYARTGVVPPPKLDTCSRFTNFIERINRRQWEVLGDVVHARLSYNKRDLSVYELVQILKQEFAPKTNTTLDLVTILGGSNDVAGPVGARLRVRATVTDPEGPYVPSAARRHFEYARHMFVYFIDDKVSHIYDIRELREGNNSDQVPDLQSIVPPPQCRPPPPRTSIDLRQFYSDYIACINSGRMAEDLGQFCSPSGVVWNGTRMSVQQYGDMIQTSLDAISGLFFDIHTLVVDERRQQVAARLEFTGTPVKPFAGGVPNGRAVAFAEHVFYWLEQGKISDVLSIVDWEEYRLQLAR